MDRCRCEEYAAAVKKIKIFTPGTLRPDVIENYDRSEYITAWIKNGISNLDMRFLKPKTWNKKEIELAQGNLPSEEIRLRNEMWCSYMTPYKIDVYDTDT